jgi:hypothetical protein
VQCPCVSSKQYDLAPQVSVSFLKAPQHADGGKHAGRLVSVNAPDD